MKTYLYLFVMAATTYLIRVLPLTLLRTFFCAFFRFFLLLDLL